MSLKSSFLLATRILKPRSGQKTVGTKSIIGAILCIALSLIPLVVVVSVSDGVIEGITERLINLSSSHLQVHYNFYQDKIEQEVLTSNMNKIKKVRGVKDAYVAINSSGLVASSYGRIGATIRAIEPSVFLQNDSYKKLFKSLDGNIEDFSSSLDSALIGKGIAEKLNLKIGDKIRLITIQKNNEQLIPKMTSFKVKSIISSGYQELDSLWFFIPLEKGIKILKPENSVSSIFVETEDPFNNLFNMQQNVEKAIDYSGSTYRWDELNRSQFENFASTKMLLTFIMMLIVLVASVNISSCVVMLTMEHRKEIAIMKSFGTKKKIISTAFIISGVLIGCIGVVIGIPIGIILSVNINSIINFIEIVINFFVQIGYYIVNGNLDSFSFIHLMDESHYLDVIPISISFVQIILYGFATILLSLLASLVPSIKASKENPIATLRRVGI